MPADRLLGTLLRSLQTYAEQQDTPRLLGTAASLLTTLNNPLNISLLTSQLLSAPAIWTRPDGLETSVRCLSVFHSAAQTLLKHEEALKSKSPDQEFEHLQPERILPKDDWIKAVIHGADGRSPPWRHILVFGGLLLGFGPRENEKVSVSMRARLEDLLVVALAKHFRRDTDGTDVLSKGTITFVLNHCFPILSDIERSRLDYDRLLPLFLHSVLRSSEGLRSSYFLGAIEMDIVSSSGSRFQWPERSNSYRQVNAVLSSHIVSSLGPLARLIGYAVEQVSDPRLVIATLEEIEDFTRTIQIQWRHTRLSEVDPSEEAMFLDDETRERTLPTLWKLLRSILFFAVIVMRSALGRAFGDAALARAEAASEIAVKVLRSLRALYFVSTRMGLSNFSQYTFVNLTAIDVLAAYPEQSEKFLKSIRPSEQGQIPSYPLERCLDLFFLNTAEHFTLVLSPETCEQVLVSAAIPYLVVGGNNHLLPIFEAAHSVMLAVFSPPHNAGVTARHLPFYVDTLFKVFPHNLSARQFRLAYKSLLRLTSPPSPISRSQPLLPATLLELLHERARHASVAPLPPHTGGPSAEESLEHPVLLSEQAILTMTVIDTFSQISLELLDEWLPLAADMVNQIVDRDMSEYCKEHFWHTLVDGEMDPDRSGVCHAWWSTRGGRDHVLFGKTMASDRVEQFVMSGGLPESTVTGKL